MGEEINVNTSRKLKVGNEGPSLLKKLWPCYLNQSMSAFTFYETWFAINIIVISNILWPGEPLHAVELGLFYGLGLITISIARFLWGFLADRYSRVKLIALYFILDGTFFILHGFTPVGGGLSSFVIILVFNLCWAISSSGDHPTTDSYVNDAAEEGERSQYFSSVAAMTQGVWLISSLVSAAVFECFWREYFWISGAAIICAGLVILFKGREPTRGSQRTELKTILSTGAVSYLYKLDKTTVKTTLLSRTNLIVFIEGIFTIMVLAIPYFVFYTYLESEPYNLSPFSVGLISSIFALPGSIIGTIFFGKLSDDYGKKGIKYRVYLLVAGLMCGYIIWFTVFFIPIDPLTKAEGANLVQILSHPCYWILGILMLIYFMGGNLYVMNQKPIIQKINLPEAQGLISAANNFMEQSGRGIGMIVAGLFLSIFNYNYQLTVGSLILIGVGGGLFWLICLKFIEADSNKVSLILQERAKEMENDDDNTKQALQA